MADGLLGIGGGTTEPSLTVSSYPPQWETGQVITADKLNYPNNKKLWIDQWGTPTFEQIQEIYNDGYSVLENDQKIGYITLDDGNYSIVLHYKSNLESIDYSVILLTNVSSQVLNIYTQTNLMTHKKGQLSGGIPLSSAVFIWNNTNMDNYLKYQGHKVFYQDFVSFVGHNQMAWLKDRSRNDILVSMGSDGTTFLYQENGLRISYQVQSDEVGYAIITATEEENPL